jgi:D-alanyl-D-alanine carboxypeptidase/D-alanyl-D-alanine-endopeptidase (penicillin-binding protein 4)
MTHRTTLSLSIILSVLIFTGYSSFTGVTASAQVVTAATPTPTPNTVPQVSAAKTVQTLASLQSMIAGRLSRPEVRRGRVGVKIVSLNTGKVVYEQDADKYFMPASNMKNFTVAAALETLGPDFRFVTSVKAASMPDSAGVVHGPLMIIGRGDVSASTSFDPAFPQTIDHYRAIDALAAQIAATGVKRVEGDLIADESYFQGFPVPETWEWDDLEGYDGTEISAFPLNDNVVDITVDAASVGQPCVVGVKPANQLVHFINNCVTTAEGYPPRVTLRKSMDQNLVTIDGAIPAGGKEFVRSIAFTHPADLYIALLKERLQLKGIAVNGVARTVNKPDRAAIVEIAKIQSPSFSTIAAKTMKPSQNMYTETILWALGEKIRPDSDPIKTSPSQVTKPDSAQLGLSAVRDFLSKVGIAPDAIVQHDGSGLSRHDLITPDAVVKLYTYMAKESRYAQVWRDSLSIAGVDGTLRNRFKGTAAAGNIRGKTGTIDQVSALSGYMSTAAGEPVVLSIIVNDVPDVRQRKSLIDDITVAVANFYGNID